jgi:hypothetical protein
VPSRISTSSQTYGTPPDKNGDYAFLLHILKSLKSTGKGAVILLHGFIKKTQRIPHKILSRHPSSTFNTAEFIHGGLPLRGFEYDSVPSKH